MSDPVWLKTARSYMGVKEAAGEANNSTIINWAKRIGGWVMNSYKKDSIPWCALFVSNCLKENNLAITKTVLTALDYSKWGQPLSKPSLGAIMTFKRQGGGHVGFYISEDKTHYHILGGNQSDSVNITKIDKARLDAIRWPSEAALPKTGPIIAVFNGEVSRNEA